MNANIEFERLVLLITRPLIWDVDPLTNAQQLGAFVRLLLESGGDCHLQAPNGAGAEWLPAKEAAVEYVDAVEQRFAELALVASQLGVGLHDWYDRFNSGAFRLFFDHACLLSAIDNTLDTVRWQGDENMSLTSRLMGGLLANHNLAVPALREAVDEHLASGQRLYFSLTVNFSRRSTDLIFTPQFGIWNYWPSSDVLAPPAPPLAAALPRLDGDQVESSLNTLFWLGLETAFGLLRSAFGLGYAAPELADLRPDPPAVFFVCPTPDCIPAQPEQYFEEGWLSSSQHLSRIFLGSADPLSADVSGALLEGELLGLRREVVQSSRSVYSLHYLVLPCQGEPARTWAEVEHKLAGVSDWLSYLEFTIVREANDLYTDMTPLGAKIGLIGGSMTDVTNIVTTLLPEVVVLPPRRRQQALKPVRLLLQRLRNMSIELTRRTTDVLQLPQRLSGYLDGTQDFIRRGPAIRRVERVNSLADALTDAYPYNYLKEPIAGAAQRAAQLRESYESLVQSLAGILDEQAREATERQASLTFWLTIAVGLLTIATVLPSLLDVQISSVAMVWINVARVFIAVTALATIIAVVGLPGWHGLQTFWARLNPPAVQRLGRQIARLWQLAEQASQYPQAMNQLDAQACDVLLPMWAELKDWKPWEEETAWLEEAGALETGGVLHRLAVRRARSPRRLFRRRMQELDDRVARFVVLSMLLDDRPYPMRLPITLLLFCYKSDDLIGQTGFVGDFEVEWVLYSAGHEDRDEIMQWCKDSARDLTAEAFVSELRERGVGTGTFNAEEIEAGAAP